MSTAVLDRIETKTAVSLKQIVGAIDAALQTIDAAPGGVNGQSLDVRRTHMLLRGVKDSVKAACLPDFEVPFS